MGFWSKLFGRQGATAGPCADCGATTNPAKQPRPDWYNADQISWWCPACKAAVCGTCSTSLLQELKTKYRAQGRALKQAIDADPQALYFGNELAPACPKCHQKVEPLSAKVQPARTAAARSAHRAPDRTRAKTLNDDGIAAAQRGDPDRAIELLRAAIDADPTWGVPWNNLGVVYRDQGNSSAALECLRKAMALDTFKS
jgi:Flp pilus assembly protein TadD